MKALGKLLSVGALACILSVSALAEANADAVKADVLRQTPHGLTAEEPAQQVYSVQVSPADKTGMALSNERANTGSKRPALQGY